MNARQRRKVDKRKKWGTWNGRFWMMGTSFHIARNRSRHERTAHRLSIRIRQALTGRSTVQKALYRGAQRQS